MSILIDELIDDNTHNPVEQQFNNESWFIAKPIEFYGICTIIKRIKDAYRVLIGKSQAFHYYEDELNIISEVENE